MFRKIAIAIAVIIIGLIIVIARKPSEFRITRTATISALPSAVFGQVNDFHNWEAWSPWAKLDPTTKSSFEGPSAGTEAIFRWAGNDKIGEGSETIIESRPNELIRIKLEFLKPFQATHTAEFTFQVQGDQTVVSWSMFGKSNFVGKAMSLVMNCDKMLGGQFEQGLAQLKSVVETAAKQ